MYKMLLTVGVGLVGTNAMANCEPMPVGTVVQESVVTGDAQSLKDHLKNTANLSEDFAKDQGMAGFDNAIAALVTKVFESDEARTIAGRGTDAPAAIVKLTSDLKDRVSEACVSQSSGDADQDTMKKTLAGLSGGDSHYDFMVGNVNSLEGDGSFNAGFEASFFSKTNYKTLDLPRIARWIGLGQDSVVGTFDITFSEIGEIQDTGDMLSDEGDDGMISGQEADPLNPFAVGGGFFRMNASLDLGYTGQGNTGVGFRFGGGLSTQPSNAENNVNASGRGFFGPVFAANYGESESGETGRGEVFIGYARDKFWEYETTDTVVDESDRIVIDGRLKVPGFFKSENVRLVARIFADTPASGDGPSDVRISLLVSTRIDSLFN